MLLAQLSVFPVGKGTSLGKFVKKGIQVIKDSGYTYSVGGLSTAIEVPDMDSLFVLVKEVRAAHLNEGAKRIVIDLKIDDRKDKDATLNSKISSVT